LVLTFLSQKMKLKPITIVEIILATLFVVSHFLKDAHIPFMGLISALSASILSMVYLAGGLSLVSYNVPNGNSYAFGFAFGLSIIALLFKFQKWPFGVPYLVMAISALLLLVIIRAVAVLAKKPQVLPFEKGIIIRYVLLIVLLAYAFLT